MLLLLLFTLSRAALVTLLPQSNPPGVNSGARDRLVCHNFTDISGSPLLYAADDFAVPSDTTLRSVWGASGCSGLQFTVTAVRLRNDADPLSLTLVLFEDNASGGPGTPIYHRTQRAPDGGWGTVLNAPTPLSVTVRNGDRGDAQSTFTLAMLPREHRLWYAFYVTGPRNFSFATTKENNMFWTTWWPVANTTLSPGWTAPPLLPGTTLVNKQYYFRDVNNLYQSGLSQWTPAQNAEPLMSVSSDTHQLAWSVSIICASAGAPPPGGNITGWFFQDQDAEQFARTFALVLLPLALFSLALVGLCFIVRRRLKARRTAARDAERRRRDEAQDVPTGNETSYDKIFMNETDEPVPRKDFASKVWVANDDLDKFPSPPVSTSVAATTYVESFKNRDFSRV